MPRVAVPREHTLKGVKFVVDYSWQTYMDDSVGERAGEVNFVFRWAAGVTMRVEPRKGRFSVHLFNCTFLRSRNLHVKEW